MAGIGRQVGGLAAIFMGAVNLAWGGFAENWQRVPAGTPHRAELAYLTAAAFLVAGAALLWKRFARPGLAVLAALYTVFTLLQVGQVVRLPAVYDSWGNVAEQLSLVAGVVAAWACLAPSADETALRAATLARVVFGVCSLSFGAVHFIYLKPCIEFTPAWLPPGPMFWSVATGFAHLLAGVALLSGVWAEIAARLATLMYFIFALGWVRVLWFTKTHFAWSGLAITLLLAGAVWMLADAIARFPPRDGALFAPGSRRA